MLDSWFVERKNILKIFKTNKISIGRHVRRLKVRRTLF